MSCGSRLVRRRDFLRKGAIAPLGLAAVSNWLGAIKPARAEASPAMSASLSPNAALKKLMAGNQRFVQQQPLYPDQSQARLKEVAQSQHPFATVLSCADSRVPPEILFDQGIGDIFDVRIAGNIATPEAIGSIEYAVALLESPLLLVLGHERCGAVTAAVQNSTLPGDIGTFVEAILPALKRTQAQPGDPVDNAVV
ncbi:MAG: carbonic anhydrase, partial [Leptolyngbyaceae cyanobacterium bins.302]|nr:carbonic anhydrase [Leptolyngbyaceae cyanobacterium bins.302]